MTVAIDFDGVICSLDTLPGYKMGQPIDGALDAIIELQSRGYTLIVFTVRGASMQGTKAVMDWLRYFKFPALPVTAVKPNSDYYIDDRAIRFIDWKQAMGAIGG